MLDHVLLDAIGALRDAFEKALLERQAFEERFTTDVLLGDIVWETSYSLPGEGLPPRVRADLTIDWPTWSQTAYRSWYIGEPYDAPPRIELAVSFRVQRLATRPDPSAVIAVLPPESAPLGTETLTRAAPRIEELVDLDGGDTELAIEVTYEGEYLLVEDRLENGTVIDEDFSDIGGWIASVLVRLGDLNLDYRPADATNDGPDAT